MTDKPVSAGRRQQLKAAGAGALAALLAACGGGGGGGANLGTGASAGGNGGGSVDAGGSTGSSGGNGGGAQPTGSITLLAGDPAADSGYADGDGATARFASPGGLAFDKAGNLYVADQYNCAIRKITPAGQVSTFAGVPGEMKSIDGELSDARFEGPTAIAIDADGNMFVADSMVIRKITAAGVVSTFANIGIGTGAGGRSAGLVVPGGIAIDGAGNLYVTNGLGTRRIAPSGEFTMLEGVATTPSIVMGTIAFVPRGITVDAGGTVYLATLDNTIARIDAGDKLVTIAGAPGQHGSADGSGAAARFDAVNALVLDRGNLIATDGDNDTIRRITPDGVVTTIAGTAGNAALQTGALPGALTHPNGVAADGKGNLFVTCRNGVVKITLP